MIPFNPADPYPLLSPESKDPLAEHSYLETQDHAAKVDAWLGLKVDDVESYLTKKGCRSRAPGALREQQQLWIGLASKSLLTPYTEIRSLLHRLNPPPGSTIVDLGTGYGRMGFVVGRHYPDVNFIGYEYVGERIKEGRRCMTPLKFAHVSLEHADLSDPAFVPAVAEYYFIYDFFIFKFFEFII